MQEQWPPGGLNVMMFVLPPTVCIVIRLTCRLITSSLLYCLEIKKGFFLFFLSMKSGENQAATMEVFVCLSIIGVVIYVIIRGMLSPWYSWLSACPCSPILQQSEMSVEAHHTYHTCFQKYFISKKDIAMNVLLKHSPRNIKTFLQYIFWI